MSCKVESFNIKGKVYIPYNNQWGEVSYVAKDPFEHDPFEILASSTSGSPVVFTDRIFIGFLNENGGRFIYDGRDRLEVIVPEGQELFVMEGSDPFLIWEQYNAKVIKSNDWSSKRDRSLYRMIEYCTWVEQKAKAQLQNKKVTHVLSESFVDQYLERLTKLGFPNGKFTIDNGWYDIHSGGGSGNFESDQRFSDLRRVARKIEEAGHVPGIWLDLGRVSPSSRYYRDHPDQVKENTYQRRQEVKGKVPFYQALPGKALERKFRDTFERLIDAGFVKFKLDMLYGNKREMKEILQLAYEIAHDIRLDIEVEAHIPDIFVSQYCDVVRTNDVLIAPDKPWRELTFAHWAVCKYSSPNHWLNLDHIGGNDPSVSETQFLAHLDLYNRVPGHPVISLLPDRYSIETQRKVKQFLEIYEENRMNDEYFTNIPHELD